MKEKLLSIVVPIYNVDQYLNKCIDSLLDQTYKNIEIILVDDGSTDRSPYICDEYSALDSRVKTIHQKNGGLSAARNSGIDASIGEYIVFVDSDDYVTNDMCEVLIKYIEDAPDVIVIDGIVIGGYTDLLHYKLQAGHIYTGTEFIKECLASGNLPMAAWLYIYKREYLIKNSLKFMNGILHEDEQFTPRALLSSNRVIYTGTAHYNYVIRENSIMTKKDKRKNAKDFYGTCLELLDIYEKLEDKKLREGLQDTLVQKYLSLFQVAKLQDYGQEYIKKAFVIKNAKRLKTRIKSWLFYVSPVLYWNINDLTKRIKKW